LKASEVSKQKGKNQATLERCKAKALAEQLMTSPVGTLATMVRPSATLLEDAEIAVVEAAISDTSAKLVEGLVEGHLYQLVNGRFVRLFVSCLGLYTRVTTLGCLTIIKNKK
jgi:hypothetical protein